MNLSNSHENQPAQGPSNPASVQVQPLSNGQSNGHSGIIQSTPVRLAYTVEEAAEALNVSTKSVRRLLARGILTASKAFRKKLIPRPQIENFLKATCDVPKSIR